ncbi:MAG: hypothetical protein NTV93_16345 [Verrucomicrobia bacterium]|nr:hypothetical protein [Verrucomicrobiota bacterium]
MAWRVDEYVVRGELDNRVRGRVRGRIWFLGMDAPVELDLEGNPWRDLAGHRIEFVNPMPKPCGIDSLDIRQCGSVGDMTVSRKVKALDCSPEELRHHLSNGTPFPWHWANTLYIEWFSEKNGRVVIETAAFKLTIDPEPTWTPTPEEETEQQIENARAMTGFMDRLVDGLAHDEDLPQSSLEAEADREDARMSALLDRIQARIEREGCEHIDFDILYEEEKERLRVERGESPPVPLTPEEEAEREAWIDELAEAQQAALDDPDADHWKEESERHPLVERCTDLALELRRTVEEAGWLSDADHPEHPLRELLDGVMIAGPKLAGALPDSSGEDGWPPDPLFAGHVLVRLKKARRHLEIALLGIESAEAEQLASPQFLAHAKRETSALLVEVRELIVEVRTSLGG